VHVKVCGITRPEDAELAVSLGAWAVGLIFHPQSPRVVDLGVAAQIGSALHRQAEVCGVFVNRPLDEVVRVADQANLSMVQLHGDEGPVYCGEVAHRTGAKVMKAARVKDLASLQALNAFRRVDYHLVDAHHPDLVGGTGQTFDWTLLRSRRSKVPLVLSGGLTPDNVAEAIRATHPWGVDTASGTEAQPGVKDPGKLQAFFRAVDSALVDSYSGGEHE
jgi:phosphoribosylanthranilate isomerase